MQAFYASLLLLFSKIHLTIHLPFPKLSIVDGLKRQSRRHQADRDFEALTISTCLPLYTALLYSTLLRTPESRLQMWPSPESGPTIMLLRTHGT